ncbi:MULTISPECIES: nucleotide exchange factor GrpE [unclassified Lysobacter]|uniref:nucleotide exchange factor GrpE n=1 Tax=unclassified Lysobacter TaxID=2635362 RepID=UPI0006F80016|nr:MULTISPECIES: nucleotide exchange factor GrpE [unclassified Lysobacter]KQZ65515.1 molecular chaperone GrpE [Lysobacter sp. Root559]KRA74545.1 molecular chaperone GrpE [Lysobacter sp. Root667]KRC38058.1 molecular chaperone GrpE [Lysobacter sp. Root76]KRD69382.1 molecular chaperone GrpE [Lysobacter sp. Root96]
MNHSDPNSELHLDEPAAAATPDEAETLRAELAQVREDALRERAELDNQRKRLARDIDMARKFANERLLGELLPVIDSLEAGLAAAGGDAGALREGMELTLRQLLKVAADNGLVAVDPTGLAFNPEHHQAMSMVPAPGVAPNHVVQVYQKGWLLNERLLRPALVVVSQDA